MASRRNPYVTGTSVLGVTFAGGVLIASDTLGTSPCFMRVHCQVLCNLSVGSLTAVGLHFSWFTSHGAGSYGSTKRYKSFQRVQKVNDCTAIGAGGELSDFQYILQLLDELTTQDFTMDDKIALNAKEVYAYLSRVLYNRRNKYVSKFMHFVLRHGWRGSCNTLVMH